MSKDDGFYSDVSWVPRPTKNKNIKRLKNSVVSEKN